MKTIYGGHSPEELGLYCLHESASVVSSLRCPFPTHSQIRITRSVSDHPARSRGSDSHSDDCAPSSFLSGRWRAHLKRSRYVVLHRDSVSLSGIGTRRFRTPWKLRCFASSPQRGLGARWYGHPVRELAVYALS